MRREQVFLPYLGRSTNEFITNQKWVYQNEKPKVEVAAMAARLNQIEPFDTPVVLLIHPRLSKRRRNFDVSNYAVSAKLIEDQLVRCGVLVDDSPKYVKGMFLGEPHKATDDIEGIRVTILEVGAGPVELVV